MPTPRRKKGKKPLKISYFDELNVLSVGLDAYPGAWKTFTKVPVHFVITNIVWNPDSENQCKLSQISDPGSPTHISESLGTIFWVKIISISFD
jgi:hypothetical protein